MSIAQVADSCSTNIKVAKLLNIPHIPCANHLLNNEVNAWVKENDTVKNTLDSVQRTMKVVKNSLKNSAVLRKLTRLAPEVGNATRWTSWGRMMGKYSCIRADLIAASQEEDAAIEVNTTNAFKKRAEKIAGLFADINMVAVSLQTRLYKLCLIRHDLDELLTECREGHTNTNSNWHGRKLPGTYINPDSDKLPDPHFVSGVIKIQLNQLLQLSAEEKAACIRLINKCVEEQEINDSQSIGLAARMKERMKKRKAGVLENMKASPYVNVDFICGSAAEVERLWSIAKHILSNSRSRMTPHLFEALIYLKINHEYWDCKSVQEAYTRAKKDAQSDRIAKMMEEDTNFAADDFDIDAAADL